MIAVWENGYRHITNSKRPINTPADLQGIKLRVPEGKWRVKMFQTYGANPPPTHLTDTQVVDYASRPIWLVRGIDRAGNDFRAGHVAP